MQFTATADKLIPDLAPRDELVLLARTLWREGYNDHLAGHITISLGDGTLLCNPWLLTWDEIRPCDVIRIDLEGNLVEGDWPVPLGIPLHLELHRARDDVRVAMHNHPQYGTVWSDMRELPPALDQSSSLGGGELVLVDEYGGSVDSSEAAAKAIAALGDADLALLAGHGVLVLGSTVRAVHQRAVALEQRCRNAWCVRAAGGVLDSPLPAWFSEQFRKSDGDGFRGFWEAMVRAELRADPTMLDTVGPVRPRYPRADGVLMSRPATVIPPGRGDAIPVEEILQRQRTAFLGDGIPDLATRIDRVDRLQAMVLDHSEEFVAALAEDFGTRAREVSVLADVVGCMGDLE